MKHQLFKKGIYVEIDTGQDHLTVISKVEDSTIKLKSTHIPPYRVPMQCVQLENKLMILHEDPDVLPMVYDDPIFIRDLIEKFNGMSFHDNKLYVAITRLEIPSKELKEMFYAYNKGAKQR